MAEIYSFCKTWGNKLFYRGWKDGRRIVEKIDYFKPKLYIKGKAGETGEWSSLYGDPLKEMSFGDIKDAKEFIKMHDGVEGFDIHGNIEYHYQYLAHRFPNEVVADTSQMGIWFIDIETINLAGDGSGFPDIQSASDSVVLISVHDKNKDTTVVFGWKDLPQKKRDYEYRQFKDEKSMLIAFITYWQQGMPDIYSGWNTSTFDTPYLVNRIVRELGEDWAKKMSPFGLITTKDIEIRGKSVQTYELIGVVELDYLELYKKYGTYSQKESFSLAAIAQDELGETKLENPGKNFKEFYDKFFDTFVDYNARDSLLVHKLDNKLKLIDLAVSVAYLAKSNLRDCLGVVKIWDVFIYNHLLTKKVAIPPFTHKVSGEFEGAYVKDVKAGMYGWTLTFDFRGLYPHIMMQWNISPETIANEVIHASVDDFVAGNIPAHPAHLSLTANGTMYHKEKRGIIPEVASIVVNGRNIAKAEMIRLQQELSVIEKKIYSTF